MYVVLGKTTYFYTAEQLNKQSYETIILALTEQFERPRSAINYFTFSILW